MASPFEQVEAGIREFCDARHVSLPASYRDLLHWEHGHTLDSWVADFFRPDGSPHHLSVELIYSAYRRSPAGTTLLGWNEATKHGYLEIYGKDTRIEVLFTEHVLVASGWEQEDVFLRLLGEGAGQVWLKAWTTRDRTDNDDLFDDWFKLADTFDEFLARIDPRSRGK